VVFQCVSGKKHGFLMKNSAYDQTVHCGVLGRHVANIETTAIPVLTVTELFSLGDASAKLPIGAEGHIILV